MTLSTINQINQNQIESFTVTTIIVLEYLCHKWPRICFTRISSSCSTSDVRRVNLVTNQVISHEWGKGREVCTTSETYPWSFVTQIFQNDNGGDRKTFDLILIKDYFNFPIVNFPFICSNIPAAPAYGVYISQFKRYFRACGYYQDLLDRGLLLTRILVNQWCLLVKCA
jgi:hypothetical protein